MTRWAVIFKDTPDMMEIRAQQDLRDAHVAYVKDHPELLIGGGLKPSPSDAFCGALWIVEMERREDVVQLIEADPFYFAKYRSFEIFTWGKILENETALL